MENIKILHSADIHADEKNLSDVVRCCEFLIQTAKTARPDAVVLAGDITNRREIRMDSDSCRFIASFVLDLSRVAPVIVVCGTPSHEGTAPLVLEKLNPGRIFVSDYPTLVSLSGSGKITDLVEPDENRKAVFSTMPTPTKKFLSELPGGIQAADQAVADALTPIFSAFRINTELLDVPHIHVGHFSVMGAAISKTQTMVGRDIEVGRDQIELSGADLVCLGHIHKSQKIGDRIFYSGSLCRNNYGEMDPKGFFLHLIRPDGEVLSEFYETPTRILSRVDFDFCKYPDGLDELDQVLYSLEPDEIKGAELRVEFSLFQDQADQVDMERIKQFYKHAGAKSVELNLIRIPRENIRGEKVLKAAGLSEKLVELAIDDGIELPETLIAKAKSLETYSREDILKEI